MMHVSSLLTGVLSRRSFALQPWGRSTHVSSHRQQKQHPDTTEASRQNGDKRRTNERARRYNGRRRIRVVGIGLRTTFVELSVKKRCHRFRVFATLCVGLDYLPGSVIGYE